jgi:hypothetical protein
MKSDCKRHVRLSVDTIAALVLLIILAFIATPEFGDGCVLIEPQPPKPPKQSKREANLQAIREQLKLYRMPAAYPYPTENNEKSTSEAYPDAAIDRPGPDGPYIQQFPPNPFIDDSAQSDKANGRPGEGWFYTPATGRFPAQTTGHEGL